MPERDIASVAPSHMAIIVEDVTVDTRETDGATGEKETKWSNEKWSQYFGYYKTIPEVKIAFDMRAIWTIGKGYVADIRTSVILDRMKGWGTDTFNSILKNMIITKRIGGDAYCEKIKDRRGTLLNLKPLDPGKMKHVANPKGLLRRYEYTNSRGRIIKFKPERIFHLMNKRVADEIHGVSDIEAIEGIIKASNESFVDMKELMHRYVRPRFIVEIDEDDEAEVDAYILKFDRTTNKGENLFHPKGIIKVDLLSVPSNATLNPMPWRDHLRNYFFQVVGIPQIILGSSGEFTESTAKIAYLAFQQSVEDEQLDIEEQIWRQLFLKIKLTFPASLQNELLSDQAKDEGQTLGMQPSDMTVTPAATPIAEEATPAVKEMKTVPMVEEVKAR